MALLQQSDGLFLISSAADRSMVIRKMVETEPLSVTFARCFFVAAQFGLNSAVICPDGDLLVACQDRQLRLYSTKGKLIKQIKGAASGDGQLTKVCLDPSGTYAATVCSNRTVYVIDLRSGECVVTLKGSFENVTDVAFSSDCRLLFRSSIVRKSLQNNNKNGCEPLSVTFARCFFVAAQFGLNSAVICPDGDLLVACQDRQLRLYSTKGKLIKQIKGAASGDGQLTKVCLDPSGTYAATVCSNRTVYVIDLRSGECVVTLKGSFENVTDVAFSSDCRRLYVVSYSGCIYIWRLANHFVNRMLTALHKLEITKSAGETRSETPDSLLGSGSGEEHAELPRNVKDLESEFGSLSSIKVGDDDSDSCIGQRATGRVTASIPCCSSFLDDGFELKRLTAEVIRLNTNGAANEQRTSQDEIAAHGKFWTLQCTVIDEQRQMVQTPSLFYFLW
ncbi:unnamed protein product [Gongylonema pulchrum]|uniref:WD_REPEATS_REGION domain-containing protein n=1 Tax=Gongylonema pulchrum TaxID=637853 RepID=A0A183DNA2_9BILA|nr:unnamed protein product [Gongylonema pulchrum]